MAVAALPLLFGLATASQDWTKVWTGVLDSCRDVSCVRGKVDMALDRALNMTSIPLVDGVTLVRSDPGGSATEVGRHGQDIFSKFLRLVTTRNINIELGNANGDGRGKKKKYAEYLYVAALVAAIVIPLKLQGLALIAGKALIIAKVALALAGSALLKKLTHDEHHRRVDVDPHNPYLLEFREQT